jgi:hypothetical protein
MAKSLANLLTPRRIGLWMAVIFLITAAASRSTVAQKRRSARATNSIAFPGWQIFTSPDGDFTLTFPGKPEPFEHDVQGPVTAIRAYNLYTKDGLIFSVNFQDIGGDPGAAENNNFGPDHERIVANAARERGERVMQVRRLAKNVYEMEIRQTLKDTGANIQRLERSILRRGRVYTLGCGSLINNKEVERSVCRKFFNSMRFRNF